MKTASKPVGARKVFERLVKIAVELTRPSGVNTPAFARRMEVSTKSIHRDLLFMRDRLALPIAYNAGEYRWELRSPEAAEKVQALRFVFANLNH